MSGKKYLEERVDQLEKDVQMLKDLIQKDKKTLILPKPVPEGETLSVNDAMKLLGLERHILYAKCNSGDIPYFRVGKLYRFKKEKLLDWLNAQKSFAKTNTDDVVKKYLLRNPIKG